MISKSDAPIVTSASPQYYRSFRSYEIPFRPDEPIEFGETEGLRSFYVAHHDPCGRVVRFDKLRVVRLDPRRRQVQLPGTEEPGATVYFRGEGDPARSTQIGERLKYSETEPLSHFFVGKVGPLGQTFQATLYCREIAFSDRYEYWPNGRLKKRTMSGPDMPESVAEYDEKGRPVASSGSSPAGHEPVTNENL
jgi:hypothetical protein